MNRLHYFNCQKCVQGKIQVQFQIKTNAEKKDTKRSRKSLEIKGYFELNLDFIA